MSVKKILDYVSHPKKIVQSVKFRILAAKGKKMGDEEFLRKLYKLTMGYDLNLDNPVNFNEKLQWLKLYNRKPEYTIMVDKYRAKEYIAQKVGKEHVVPNLGMWENFDDIDFDALPEKFVLKCNHDCGGLIICKDKSKLDIEAARKKINNCLNKNYYMSSREWPYKNVKPCIIAEEYLELPQGLTEYKLFSFNGKAEIVLVCKGIAHTASRTNTFFDRAFNKLPIQSLLPNQKEEEQKPAQYEKMLEIADKLSEGIPQVRVDFYVVNERVYVGEMTFFHNSGLCKIVPEEWERKMGDLIILPEKTVGE